MKLKTDSQVKNRERIIKCILLMSLGMVLYLGFLSNSYDLNGIAGAAVIEHGGIGLFAGNHMLYRPLVWLFYTSLRTLGYTGRAILPAQIITAVCGAAGLGLFYWWLGYLVRRDAVSILASVGYGTSWAYWAFSTDAFYIIPAATALIGALILFSRVLAHAQPHPPARTLAGLGTLCALAILLWRANIFFLPVVLFGLFVKYKDDKRCALASMTLFLVPLSVLVGSVYLFVGVFLQGQWSLLMLLKWLSGYGGAQLPIWGRWDIKRLNDAAISAVASIIPVCEGLGLRALLRGEIQAGKFLSQISLLALTLLFILPLFTHFVKRSLSCFNRNTFYWLSFLYLAYWPFIVWWDPFEPKWFVIPNIGLWALFAVCWDSITKHYRCILLFAGLILAISLANLSGTIWPRHSQPNTRLQKAQFVAEHMGEHDLFVAVEWNWPGYLVYFFERQVFSLISSAARTGKEQALNLLRQDIASTHQRNGKVYMVALDTYPPEYMDWLASQTGLLRKDFQSFQRETAFFYDVVRFEKLKRIK